jgi:hypothetical protein
MEHPILKRILKKKHVVIYFIILFVCMILAYGIYSFFYRGTLYNDDFSKPVPTTIPDSLANSELPSLQPTTYNPQPTTFTPLISDLEKPLEIPIKGDYTLQNITVTSDPHVSFILRKNPTNNTLLLYPDPKLEERQTYTIQIREGPEIIAQLTVSTGTSPTDIPYQFDGLPPQDFDDQQTIARSQTDSAGKFLAKLRLNGLTTDAFRIEYSYDKKVFLVTFTSPEGESRQKFEAWRLENNLKDNTEFLIHDIQ